MTDETVLEQEIVSEPEVQEKMLPVSRVEELVKKAKLKGRDSMQSELDALKAENENLKSNGSMGGMQAAPTVDADAIKQQIMNDLRTQFQEANEKRAKEEIEIEGKKIYDSYQSKMQAGKQQYEDFDEIMSDFDPREFPNVVWLASQMDDPAGLMRELKMNPQKLANIAMLSERSPKTALDAMNKISASIKANEQAKAEDKDAPPPLGRMSSSVTTGQDNGTPSVRDFKAMFRG